MAAHAITHKRNLFEVDNARNLSMQEMVETFIPTQAFWRLLSAKNHVILGARGHGKTALARMLSHDHLALLARLRREQRAATAIRDQEFIGVYLPTRLEWVGGLRNKPWLDEKEREELFQWRLNVASCIAFLPIVKSCIAAYVAGDAQQARAERTLAHQLSSDWLGDELVFDDLTKLRFHLEDTDYQRQCQLLRIRASGSRKSQEVPIGLVFGMELFFPLRQGIRRLSRLLSINPDCTWLLCLDEAEVLEEMDHRIINSHMRAYPENLFFKITTMPYCHYTLATNTNATLVPGQDFEYVNMDSDRVLKARAEGETNLIGTRFGRDLFKRLVKASCLRVSTDVMDALGASEILDSYSEEWGENSVNMNMLEKYASPKTVDRARRLVKSRKFGNEVGRKIHGALLLRKAYDDLRGNRAITVYSGATMAIRCADDNPRRLIRIFNALLMLRSSRQARSAMQIPRQEQTRALQALSKSTLTRVRSEPDVGPDLHAFLCMLGEYMKADLFEKPLITDQISSITVDDTISEEDWKLIQVAVGQGLLYPNISSGNPDEIPWREGTFHLAYILAPHFFLLPRHGKAKPLQIIQRYSCMKSDEKRKFIQTGENQLSLFGEGGEQ